MFWSNAGTSSNIDQILDEPGVTLHKVLEQDEVLQELRAQNKKLVEYLSRADSLTGMIYLITTEPSEDVPLVTQYKLPNVACEILTSDNAFVEKVTGDSKYLEKLFHFFRDKPSPINPLLASYACRVLTEIISRKPDQNWYSYQLNLIQIMSYLQGEANVLNWLLNHLDCSAVCEFFHKLMLNVEGQDMRNSLYEWMVTKEQIILKIMQKMTRHELEDVHANVSRLVGDLLYAFQDEMINSSQERNSDCDPFLQALRSHETITTLLTTLFTTDAICETSIMHGLDLVLSLLGVTRRSPRQSGRNDSLDEANDGLVLSEDVKAELLARMPTLLNLLESPVDHNALPMTYGLLEKPVGLGRLAIAKFIAHLFTLNDDELNMGMINSGVLKQLLDLFWSNPWNSFLHRYVCKIMVNIAKSAQISPGSVSYLMDMGLLSKILQVFENKELKCGYKGHLAKVAAAWGEATVVESVDEDGNVSNVMKDLMHKLEESDKELYTKWDVFISDTLEEYFTSEKVLLAGVHPPALGGLLSSGAEVTLPGEADSSFSTGAGTMQWLSSYNTADSFLNLSISESDDFSSSKAKSLFEMFCNEKSNSFDEDDDDEDIDAECRKKHSLDLSSPDSDSLDEEKWTDAEKKLNLDANTSLDEMTAAEDDIFASYNEEGNSSSIQFKSPPALPIIPVVGIDPWSNLDNSNNGTDQDQWTSAELLFASDSAATSSGALGISGEFNVTTASEQPSGNGGDDDWAKFDQVQLDASAGGGDEWANFESAAFPLEMKSCPDSVTNSESIGDVNNKVVDNVIVDDVTKVENKIPPHENDDNEEMQQFQSNTAKEETVSASQQQVSATN